MSSAKIVFLPKVGDYIFTGIISSSNVTYIYVCFLILIMPKHFGSDSVTIMSHNLKTKLFRPFLLGGHDRTKK